MSTTWDERTLIEDVLASGVDDWLDLSLIIQIARRVGVEDPVATRAIAIGLVAEVVMSGLVEAGEVTDDGFRPWDMTRDAALGRIIEQWLAYGVGPPTPGAICWLAVTAEGEARGTEVLRREGSAP